MTGDIGTAVLPDNTGEIICPEDQGNIPLGGPNPPRGEQTLLPGGGGTGGGGPPLTDDVTGTGDVERIDPLAPGGVQQNEQTEVHNSQTKKMVHHLIPTKKTSMYTVLMIMRRTLKQSKLTIDNISRWD